MDRRRRNKERECGRDEERERRRRREKERTRRGTKIDNSASSLKKDHKSPTDGSYIQLIESENF